MLVKSTSTLDDANQRKDALVRVHHAMHEAVRLPAGNHGRIPACNLQNEVRTPRATRRQRELQHLVRNPLAEDTQALPVRLLLAAAEEEHVRRPVERLEVPDPQERRRHTRQHTRCLRCLALNSELWEGHQRERARGRDVESLHRCQHGLY